jgi:hypothetical protein
VAGTCGHSNKITGSLKDGISLPSERPSASQEGFCTMALAGYINHFSSLGDPDGTETHMPDTWIPKGIPPPRAFSGRKKMCLVIEAPTPEQKDKYNGRGCFQYSVSWACLRLSLLYLVSSSHTFKTRRNYPVLYLEIHSSYT